MPYTLNSDTSQISSVVMDASRHSSPCSQKSPNNTSTQCNPNVAYVTSALLYIHSSLPLQLGMMIFFTYLVALCSGFNTSIYKPPKYLSKRD